MKKLIIALSILFAFNTFAIEVPEGTAVEKEVTTIAVESVEVVAIHHPLIFIRSNKDTGEISMTVKRDKYLANGEQVTERRRFSQTEIIALLGGVAEFQQVFGAIEAGLQEDVNSGDEL